jgi:tRNA(Ile)-lysidine synthase TilS/MesJ
MPAVRVDAHGLHWLRPLIDVPRIAIEAYVADRALRYIDDESNGDTRLRAQRAAAQRCAGARGVLARLHGHTRTFGAIAG